MSGRIITTLCVDDHPVVLEGIAGMIATDPTLKLVATATCGRDAIDAITKITPDVVLTDLKLPDRDGVDLIAEIHLQFPAIRILALTTYAGDVLALRALKAGATGYLLKSMLRTDLLTAIHEVHAGRRRIAPEVAANIAQYVGNELLSDREMDVLRGLSRGGGGTKAIASELRISQDTVRAHLKSIFLKLHANDRTQALMIAVQRGILD